MTEVREAHTSFEAVKLAMNHDKRGHILRLVIHPNDTPESVMRDFVGTRYMVVLVRMNEQGEVVPSPVDDDGRKAVALAGTLCSDKRFQSWLARNGNIDDMSEEAAAIWLREFLGIASRKELSVDAEARKKLYNVRDEFVTELRSSKLLR